LDVFELLEVAGHSLVTVSAMKQTARALMPITLDPSANSNDQLPPDAPFEMYAWTPLNVKTMPIAAHPVATHSSSPVPNTRTSAA